MHYAGFASRWPLTINRPIVNYDLNIAILGKILIRATLSILYFCLRNVSFDLDRARTAFHIVVHGCSANAMRLASRTLLRSTHLQGYILPVCVLIPGCVRSHRLLHPLLPLALSLPILERHVHNIVIQTWYVQTSAARLQQVRYTLRQRLVCFLHETGLLFVVAIQCTDLLTVFKNTKVSALKVMS